jgi:hypothetical protein
MMESFELFESDKEKVDSDGVRIGKAGGGKRSGRESAGLDGFASSEFLSAASNGAKGDSKKSNTKGKSFFHNMPAADGFGASAGAANSGSISRGASQPSHRNEQEAENDSDDESNLPPPVNVDLNLLKNLLESYSLQMGGSGPASNLLSQLGLQMPRPPPADKKDTKP